MKSQLLLFYFHSHRMQSMISLFSAILQLCSKYVFHFGVPLCASSVCFPYQKMSRVNRRTEGQHQGLSFWSGRFSAWAPICWACSLIKTWSSCLGSPDMACFCREATGLWRVVGLAVGKSCQASRHHSDAVVQRLRPGIRLE